MSARIPQPAPWTLVHLWVKRFMLDRWYCLHCPLDPEHESRSFGEPGAKAHASREHDIPSELSAAGVDYAEGFQARIIFRRRDRESAVPAARMARYMLDPAYDVEAFLTDCGDELWDRRDE